ncbi:synaptonemal complex protein 1-like [Chironomus tepperi]|uniref:synaptonemal complex protein 1-like n=1 Tax=Chironomus tepperi TaxID=113505 RepID=UPI00391FC764
MADQTSASKNAQTIKSERQIELLKKKIQELTSENQILREINVKLQIENFNLQKKLESKQLDEELDYGEIEKLDAETDDHLKSDNVYTIDFENENETETAEREEYLEQEEPIYAIQEEEILKHDQQLDCKPLKRDYSEVFVEKDIIEEKPLSKVPKEDNSSYQITIINPEYLDDDVETIETESGEITPKDAIEYIYKIASKSSMTEKIKSIEKGKQKDSAFVSKVLDLLFDRVTLANSTAHGQKCQSKLHLQLPARPPLDPVKMDLSLKAFMYRLFQEEISEAEKQARLKLFNKLVNDKIQNCRKCLTRTDASKVLET